MTIFERFQSFFKTTVTAEKHFIHVGSAVNKVKAQSGFFVEKFDGVVLGLMANGKAYVEWADGSHGEESLNRLIKVVQ